MNSNHERRNELDWRQTEETADADEILAVGVDPEVSDVQLVAESELLKFEDWLKINEAGHVDDGGEVDGLVDEDVESQVVHVGQGLD